MCTPYPFRCIECIPSFQFAVSSSNEQLLLLSLSGANDVREDPDVASSVDANSYSGRPSPFLPSSLCDAYSPLLPCSLDLRSMWEMNC